MKKIASILVLIAIFALTGCTEEETTQVEIAPEDSEPTIETPVRLSEGDLESLELFLDINIDAPADINGEKAYPIQKTIFVDGLPFRSDPTFKIITGKIQTINYLNGLSILFEIMEDETLNLTFPKNETANHTVNSYLGSNSSWFTYSFIVLSESEFYVVDGGGHEGFPQYKYFDGETLSDFSPLIKESLADEFADDSSFPKFKLNASDSYIYFEEETYFSDTLYDSTNEERANFRKTFMLDRETLEIISEDKVER